MRAAVAVAPLLLALAAGQRPPADPAPTFACTAGALTLTVQAQPPAALSYSVASTLTGAAWLEGGGLALLQNGAYLTPGAGLLMPGAPQLGAGEDALGAFTFLSVPWEAQGGAPFTANFSCYAEHFAFALHFPEGYSPASPSQTALPATHFPSFKATAATLLSPAMGFVEWAGEMDSYGNAHGVGLQGYKGGVESGPLLLFNASQLALGGALPQALVLGPGGGPGTHVAHGVLRVVRDPAAPPPPPAAPCSASSLDCYSAPHTDKVGGDLSPGVQGGGLLVQAGNASACCAACAALGQLCDSWVYDTDGEAGGNNCWPLLGITGSKQGMGDRDLGLAPHAAPPCPAPMPNASPANSTPSLGFEAGVGNSTPAACCRLCATLGASACAAWVLRSATGTCMPLLTASPERIATPGLLTGAPATLPMVLAAGVQGRIAAFPPRFASVWVLAGAEGGLSDAVMAYGWALRRAAGLQRLDKALDPMRNSISYWADNGQYYYDGYWPLFFNASGNTAEKIYLALKAYHASLGLSVGTYQMDPWWYGGSCGASGPPPPQCHNAGAWPWSGNWSAAPGFFPSGLGALGLPLTLYSNNYAQAPLNAMAQFEWVNCTSCLGGVPPYARVAAEQSYDFHSYIFDAGAAWGMNAFEVDFADFMFEGFADFGTDVRAFDAYWEGLNRASAEHGFPTQLCMGLPAITLSTPQWSHVTNARLAGDGYVTNGARYDIFQTSLLYAAVELAPFLDGVWSTGCQPAPDNAYGNATCEPHSEALIAIATLSAGPVGFGDGLGFTNATLLNMTCRSDGVLLQPSLPAVNLEAYYAGALAPAGARARIATAPSSIPAAPAAAASASSGSAPYPRHFRAQPPQGAQYTFLTVLAAFVGAEVRVAAGDVWRGGSSSGSGALYAQQRSRAAACTEGAPAVASGCAARCAGGGSDTLLTASTGAEGHELWSIAPELPGGWAVLGELGKLTRHSPQRLQGVDPGCSGRHAAPSLCLTALGAAGEALQLAFVDPSGAVRLASLALGGSGSAAVACSCAQGGCACAAEATPAQVPGAA